MHGALHRRLLLQEGVSTSVRSVLLVLRLTASNWLRFPCSRQVQTWMILHIRLAAVAYFGGEVGVGIVPIQHALQLLVKGGSIQGAASQYAHELVDVSPIPLQQA